MDILEKKLPPKFLIFDVDITAHRDLFIKYFLRILEWMHRFPVPGNDLIHGLTIDMIKNLDVRDLGRLRWDVLYGAGDIPIYQPTLCQILVHPYSLDQIDSGEFRRFRTHPNGVIRVATLMACCQLDELVLDMARKYIPDQAFTDLVLFSYKKKQYKKLLKHNRDSKYFYGSLEKRPAYASALKIDPKRIVNSKRVREVYIATTNQLGAEKTHAEFYEFLARSLEVKRKSITVRVSFVALRGMGGGKWWSSLKDAERGRGSAHALSAVIHLDDMTVEINDSNGDVDILMQDHILEAIQGVPGYETAVLTDPLVSIMEVCRIPTVQGQEGTCVTWNTYTTVLGLVNPNFGARTVSRIFSEYPQSEKNKYMHYFLWVVYHNFRHHIEKDDRWKANPVITR